MARRIRLDQVRRWRGIQRPLPPEAFNREETYRATRLPVELASTLIPDAYGSAVLRPRARAGLRASWVPVCVADEVREPGDFLVVEVAGRSLIVCRNRDGELRAFHNVCRHRGARLCERERGHVERFFQCPYHAWAYDLDGACLGTPLFTATPDIPEDQQGVFDMADVKASTSADHGLLPGRASTRGAASSSSASTPSAPPLAERARRPARAAGRLPARRVAARAARGRTRSQANWKLIAENFMEYYHLPWVHPGLVKVSPMEAHHRWQGPGMYVGFCTSPIAAEHRRTAAGSGLPRDRRAERGRRRRARASRGCSRTSR